MHCAPALPSLLSQVVSEASDAGVRAVVRHCHIPKLVPQICDVLTGDKNAKLRKHCSGYLLQVLEEWEVHEYSHYIDAVEAGLTAAVQDALGETRTNGRTAFAAYAAATPDRAAALLRRFDGSMQQKLQDAVLEYGRGGHAGAALVCGAEILWHARGAAGHACSPAHLHLLTAHPAPSRTTPTAHAVVAAVKSRPKSSAAPSKPWMNRGGSASSALAEPEIVIVAGPMPPAGRQQHKASGSSRVSLAPAAAAAAHHHGGAQRSSMGPPAPVPLAALGAGALAEHGYAMAGAHSAAPPAGPARNSRKSVAGVPMRVPGGPLLQQEASGGDAGGIAAVGGRNRRTSMMPQRVPQASAAHHELPPGGLAPGASGYAAGRVATLPDGAQAPGSPDSCAHSDASGAAHESSGAGR
jgi:hypothetical protein